MVFFGSILAEINAKVVLSVSTRVLPDRKREAGVVPESIRV
jgi:hypothetical protein